MRGRLPRRHARRRSVRHTYRCRDRCRTSVPPELALRGAHRGPQRSYIGERCGGEVGITAKRSTRILFRRRWLIRLASSRVSSFAGSRARPRNDDGECLPIMVTDDEARRGLFDGPLQVGLGGLSVVVLGEQLTRLGKQHRENQSGSHDHNRPKPIPPTRGLLLCIGRWWSDFRFISCGLLAHFWDPIAIDELIPARFRGRIFRQTNRSWQ